MAMRLSAEQLARYREQGFLAVEGLIPPAQVEALRRRLEELCRHAESEEGRRVHAQLEPEARSAVGSALAAAAVVRKFDNLTLHELVFREHALFPPLAEAVADLIGTPVSLYVDQAMLKPPRYGSEKPPHQDNAYFRVEPAEAGVTAWCALDDASIANGCMEYLPGSHRLGLVEHEGIAGTPHLVPRGELGAFVAVPVPAGSVVFHHYLTLHRSKPNHSDTWRRAFICHYVRSDARMPRRAPDAPALLRVR
jgi:ectoine hydroxylase-related dioxygenase (phytanoyl-CoA dioxygenase family)